MTDAKEGWGVSEKLRDAIKAAIAHFESEPKYGMDEDGCRYERAAYPKARRHARVLKSLLLPTTQIWIKP